MAHQFHDVSKKLPLERFELSACGAAADELFSPPARWHFDLAGARLIIGSRFVGPSQHRLHTGTHMKALPTKFYRFFA